MQDASLALIHRQKVSGLISDGYFEDAEQIIYGFEDPENIREFAHLALKDTFCPGCTLAARLFTRLEDQNGLQKVIDVHYRSVRSCTWSLDGWTGATMAVLALKGWWRQRRHVRQLIRCISSRMQGRFSRQMSRQIEKCRDLAPLLVDTLASINHPRLMARHVPFVMKQNIEQGIRLFQLCEWDTPTGRTRFGELDQDLYARMFRSFLNDARRPDHRTLAFEYLVRTRNLRFLRSQDAFTGDLQLLVIGLLVQGWHPDAILLHDDVRALLDRELSVSKLGR